MGIRIRPTFQTEIYTTQGGYVALKQEDNLRGGDSVVLLSADQLPTVINELQALLSRRETWEGDIAERTEDEEEPAAG